MKRIVFTVFTGILLSISAQAQHTIETTRQFTVIGAVEQSVTISVADIRQHTPTALGEVVVKNHKGEEKKVARAVKGVLLTELLANVKIKVDKPKQYSELVVLLTASDGYKNVYSWNELFNTEVGKHVYVITEMDGKTIDDMPNAIIVVSAGDVNVF
jgi:hypothetical protein